MTTQHDLTQADNQLTLHQDEWDNFCECDLCEDAHLTVERYNVESKTNIDCSKLDYEQLDILLEGWREAMKFLAFKTGHKYS